MDDSNGTITTTRHHDSDAHDAHKRLKQERRLRERLSEAREAEARARDRFQRVQSKLQRREARVAHLENRLQALHNEPASPPIEQRDMDVNANGHIPPSESAREEASASVIAISPEIIATSAPEEAPTQTETQETQKLEEIQEKTEQTLEIGEIEETEETLEIVEILEVAEAPAAPDTRDALDLEPFVTPELPRDAELFHEQTSEPEAEQPSAEALLLELASPVEVDEASEPSTVIPEAEAETEEAKERLPEQVLIEAREEWKMANADVHLARNRAHDMAASISTLVQSGLSGTLMEELLRKQAEANKALNEAQQRARQAYEQLVQAEANFQQHSSWLNGSN